MAEHIQAKSFIIDGMHLGRIVTRQGDVAYHFFFMDIVCVSSLTPFSNWKDRVRNITQLLDGGMESIDLIKVKSACT